METTSDSDDGHHAGNGAFAYRANEAQGAQLLFAEHYDTLKRIARSKRRAAEAGETMQTTDFLHETFAKIAAKSDFADDNHFLSCTALAMRQVLTDYVRFKMRTKRGGGQDAIPLEDAPQIAGLGSDPHELLLVSDLMAKLEEFEPRLVRVVDCIYFAGYSAQETAQLLEVSSKTIQRDWAKARAFLLSQVR